MRALYYTSNSVQTLATKSGLSGDLPWTALPMLHSLYPFLKINPGAHVLAPSHPGPRTSPLAGQPGKSETSPAAEAAAASLLTSWCAGEGAVPLPGRLPLRPPPAHPGQSARQAGICRPHREGAAGGRGAQGAGPVPFESQQGRGSASSRTRPRPASRASAPALCFSGGPGTTLGGRFP